MAKEYLEYMGIIFIAILVLGLFFSITFGLSNAIENYKCEPYKIAGFEVDVNAKDGCVILFNGEFIHFYVMEEYFEIQDLKEKLDVFYGGNE